MSCGSGDSCPLCRDGEGLEIEFSMAFQPIVDVEAGDVYAHEALVRGPGGEPAPTVLDRVGPDNRYAFDQACRVRAVRMAAELGMPGRLSINFLPNAVYEPEHCIRTTLEACERHDFPVDRIIFEITEVEQVVDHAHLRGIVREYQRQGFLTAIDDFGAGYSGLNRLADLRTDLIKLDMAVVRGIDRDVGRQAIVRGVLQVCRDLGIGVIAEGVETPEELRALRDFGITRFQGFLFARPGFETLPEVPASMYAGT